MKNKSPVMPIVIIMIVILPVWLFGQEMGDANNNGIIDIVDALVIAQYYVGLNPGGFYPNVSDVNADGSIDIIDALLVAQYYVGLIHSFPAGTQQPSPVPTPVGTPAATITWDFSTTTEGWICGFADYPAGSETFYELASGWATLPSEVGAGGGMMIHGNNHSDDLFMFMKREITGLVPKTKYTLDTVAVIDTNAPADCGGIGGAPGLNVYFKIGASAIEPVGVLDTAGYLRLNIDKGNQAGGGADMKVAGDIGNTYTCPDPTYQSKTLALTGFSVISSATGTIWLILGTDSGFEGITTLYYDRITVRIVTQ